MKILVVGDVVGRPGRKILQDRLQGIVDTRRIDFVIVNGENAAGGKSITPAIVKEFQSMGVDVITSGNHIWDNSEIVKVLDSEPTLLRPANYPAPARGYGYHIADRRGVRICVVDLQGRLFMDPIDCPFRKFDEIYKEVRERSDIIIVDFHAEATSEKRALGWHLDGRASALYGTHTHVMTADEEILPRGTGFITDIGMTGSFDSVIGVNKENAVRRFLTFTRVRFEVAEKNCKVNAVLFEINREGKTESIVRIIA
ncbi:MAG: TIGR00282 family metallophosphoesterase [Chrysiogenales bacterium]|nr:MAG: TIGR00282 family metallophosphoesterase [Chrysiogenales bacterium]